jgi:hypothetical protein
MSNAEESKQVRMNCCEVLKGQTTIAGGSVLPGKASSLALQLITVSVGIIAANALYSRQPLQLTINWDKVIVVSRTTPTLQVVVNPSLGPGRPLGAAAYRELKELGADYVRYVPWLPYRKLAVAELEPPTPRKTSWDFSLIDPMTKEFLAATDGHPMVMNFSTTAAWMRKTDKPVTYPADPDQVDWLYGRQGKELRDPSGKELGDDYAPLVSWYVDGGFTDENGVKHESGYNYKFPVWEVLNEPRQETKATALTVDQQTGDNPARGMQLAAGTIQLESFAVTVVSW